MSLRYDERQQLAAMLRRHVRTALVSKYENAEYRDYLVSLIDRFEAKGYRVFKDVDDQNAFNELLRSATY